MLNPLVPPLFCLFVFLRIVGVRISLMHFPGAWHARTTKVKEGAVRGKGGEAVSWGGEEGLP